MGVPSPQFAFSAGEIGPSLFGRVDVAKTHVGVATGRNVFVDYRGGLKSRAGTLFCGYSKQTGRAYPPRLLTFQYSINQGLALEFGNYYMRVLYNGAFITEPAIGITNITQANPAIATFAANVLSSAIADISGVTATYAPGDTITLAGGTFSTAGVLAVQTTQLASIAVDNAGDTTINNSYLGYFPGDQITLNGGSGSARAVLSVLTTKVVAVAAGDAGSGGTPGAAVVTGTTGTGTKFQANVTIGAGGTITSVNSIALAGSYTVNPTYTANTIYVGVWPYGHYQTNYYYIEPVTGGGLTGARIYIQMGIETVAVLSAGSYTANPAAAKFTQASDLDGGTGATFKNAVMGPLAVTVSNPGVYTVLPTNPVSQASSSGTGLGVTFTASFTSGATFNSDDWAYLSGIGGMTELNGRTIVAQNVGANQFALYDAFGNAINSIGFSAYTSGGMAARIFTLTTPWSEQDLKWIKKTQSADVMSMCCVNQDSLTEYAAQELSRLGPTSWTIAALSTTPTISAPASCLGSASSAGSVYYAYEATAVNPADGSESVASPIASISSAVNITATAGAITLTCGLVSITNQYNWYRAPIGYAAAPPTGSIFGYIGSSYGPQFIDDNIVPDFAQVPPTHKNPFARGQVIGLNLLTAGSSIATISYSVTTSTGSGLVLQLVIVSGALAGWIVVDPGQNYQPSDTITFSVTGGGAVAPTATLSLGASSGTYPGVPFYFQQRRGYAYTINQTDTYWMSQPGAYTNFDARIPTIDSDAITGTPWAQQVNGIQWAIPMPGGLVVLTGLGAWQISGGGATSAITPSSQQAIPQAFNGVSPFVEPIRIDNFILYVQSLGATYRLLAYDFFTNIYTGSIHTIYSPQLFNNYTIIQNAYCEQPYRTVWAVRNDGVLLCDTFLAAQEINGWTRHDTQGLYKSVCSVTEPPVDALYAAVERTINGQTSYMIERFDNRLWTSNENCWCVDAGLALPQPTPDANISASASTGGISGYTGLVGGADYGAATQFHIVDQGGGPGSGATVTGTIVGGVVTALTIGTAGSLYANPIIYAVDPSGGGSGFSATLTVNQNTTLTADAAVFSVGDVGSVVRMNGGRAAITAYTSSTVVTAQVISPFVSGIYPLKAASGDWTMTAPVASIGGLWHLAGADVVGTADGAAFSGTVDANGNLTLPNNASNIVAGLAFLPQIQSVYQQDSGGGPTVQGRRKKDAALVARVEASYGFTMGSNQVDGSTVNPPQIAPTWIGLQAPTYNYSIPPYGLNTPPLYTGDVRLLIQGSWKRPGQIAVEQPLPLPLNLLALIPDVWEADTPEEKFSSRRGAQQPGAA